MPQDRRHLYRIGNRWYARIPVPGPLRGTPLPFSHPLARKGSKLGPYVQKALGTSDIRQAQRRRWDIHREARDLFCRLLPANTEAEQYRAWRAALADAGHWETIDLSDGTTEQGNPALENILEETRELPPTHPAMEAVRDHFQDLKPLSELLDEFLEKNPPRSQATVTHYRAVVRKWVDHHGDRSLSPRWVSKRLAASWLETVTEGKAKETVKHYVSAMSKLWDWQHRLHDDVPTNPFEKLSAARGSVPGRRVQSYIAFTDDELVRLLSAAEDDRELYPVILTGMYSGMRLGEVLKSRRETVGGVECFVIDDSKTENSTRVIPVHPMLTGVRVGTELKDKALSVRFSRLRKRIGIDDSRKVFHSLRKCFTSKLEQAGCPEIITVRLLGHKPISLSYSLYSAGQDVLELRRWVSAVRYADPVDPGSHET